MDFSIVPEYFGLISEVFVGILGFQVIAVSLVLSKKGDWYITDTRRLIFIILSNMVAIFMAVSPYFIIANQLDIEFWKNLYFVRLIGIFIATHSILVVVIIEYYFYKKGKIKEWSNFIMSIYLIFSIFLPYFNLIRYLNIDSTKENQLVIFLFVQPWVPVIFSFIAFAELIIHSHGVNKKEYPLENDKIKDFY